jgi:ribosome-binding factor A
MAEMVREQVSDIFQNHLRDPRLGWVSVVRVDLSADLRHAKVYVSVFGNDEDQESSFRAIHRATGAVRSELSRRLRVKRVPEIVFRVDRSVEYSLRVEEILRELGLSGGAPDGHESGIEGSE